MSVVLETTLGDITVDLFTTERPQTCRNFLALCALKYYNRNSFHFVQADFIAQSGDPTGTGSGGESAYAAVHGPSGRFFDAVQERNRPPKLKHDRAGLLSMVNNGEDLHGSQFFFTLSHSLDYLDSLHTVFGEIVEGQEVLTKLNETITDEAHRPYQDILITHTVILEDPFPPIKGLRLPSSSPEYDYDELLKNSDRLGIGDDADDLPPEKLEEALKDKDAKQRALVLEMIGDLPDADMAPPENVLFICKLNPVTREEDLEVIFSRFGGIVSCEIITDEKTGESLQYGFIEFERPEDCEKAYFKMDNVLIDDRRIHVDFSQSVSKLKWKGKGRGVTYLNDENEQTNERSAANYVRSMGGNSNKNNGGPRGGRPPPPPPPSNSGGRRGDYHHHHQPQQQHQQQKSSRSDHHQRGREDFRRRSRSPAEPAAKQDRKRAGDREDHHSSRREKRSRSREDYRRAEKSSKNSSSKHSRANRSRSRDRRDHKDRSDHSKDHHHRHRDDHHSQHKSSAHSSSSKSHHHSRR